MDDEKEKLKGTIAEQAALIEKLTKKLDQKSYVLGNLDLFDDLMTKLEVFQHNGKSKYFYERTSSFTGENESIFKINSFVQDLIEYKCRVQAGDNYQNRISMDISALIKFLNTGRRVRKTKDEIEALKRERNELVHHPSLKPEEPPEGDLGRL